MFHVKHWLENCPPGFGRLNTKQTTLPPKRRKIFKAITGKNTEQREYYGMKDKNPAAVEKGRFGPPFSENFPFGIRAGITEPVFSPRPSPQNRGGRHFASEQDTSSDWLNLIGKDRLQAYQDSYAQMHGISLVFLNTDGEPLTVRSNASLFCCAVAEKSSQDVARRATAIWPAPE